MATVNTTAVPQPNLPPAAPVEEVHELRIYSHSSLFYWWPVWAVGFALALVTWLGGHKVLIGDYEVYFHPSKNLGVFYGVTLFLVILISNVTVRGQASLIVILLFLFLTVLFAYLGWWEVILSWMPHLALYANMGFYLFTSALLFIAWFFAICIYDRMTYWSLRPGQMTQVTIIGSGERSYDTRGMVFEKQPFDLFRNRILGLGSGDVRIHATGARNEEFVIPNVLFVERRLQVMQQLVATKPEEHEQPATV